MSLLAILYDGGLQVGGHINDETTILYLFQLY
jgi:hypothetical protein